MVNFIAGLNIIKTYNADAPLVTYPYGITVPKVLKDDMSVPHREAIELLGWQEHPMYHSYFYPVETATELANIDQLKEARTRIVTP